MSLLVESIKVMDGKLLNISYHNERMIRTLYMIFGIRSKYSLEEMINVPDSVSKGIFKCRVLYDNNSVKFEFLHYTIRRVNTLKMVNGSDLCYPYKYADRKKINMLFEMRGDCDDIIIVKNGFITDSSYSNLIFKGMNGEWVTPSSYLLPGTKRELLLKNRLIAENQISVADLQKYSEVKLINAMIDPDDTTGIPIGNICHLS